MLRVPISARAVLKDLVAATEACGYAGMLVVLARKADAPQWHDGLTTDWTSIHDVTGPFVAVICPDPFVLRSVRDMNGVDCDAEVNGFGVVRPPGLGSVRQGNDKSFDSRYSALNRGNEERRRVPRVPFRTPFACAALSPDEEELLHAAWSEATSRCASYFGLSEEIIPSVLVLCFRERIAFLARLPEDAPLYAFCKDLITGLGDAPWRMDLLRAERAELIESLSMLRFTRKWEEQHPPSPPTEPPPPPEPPDPVPGQLRGLDRHLELVADADPELVARWRTRLSALAVEPPYTDVLDLVREIADWVSRSTDKYRWRRLDRKARKVVRVVNDVVHPKPVFSSKPFFIEKREPTDVRIARAEHRLAEVERELAELDGSLRFADSVQAAASRVLGSPQISHRPGRDGLDGWQLRILEADGRKPLSLGTQRV